MADNIDIDVEEELEDNIELNIDEAFVEAVSPRASVVATPSGALITITDIEGTTSVAVSNGAKGDTGVGITSLYVSEEDYHLYVELTTGETVDTGVSIRGSQGETGVGVSDAYVDMNYHLIIELTDGTAIDTGQSVKGDKGDTGNGIASVSIDSNGYLHITFTDETEYTSDVTLFGQVQDVIVNGASVVGNTGEAEFDVPDNLVNGSAIGSLRGVGTATEGQSYTIGQYATASGILTSASGGAAHAEGAWTKASNDGAHAEGNSTTASGLYSHAEGAGTKASADYAHAEGYHTKASSRKQHVFGQYNVEDSIGKYVEIVGNGSSGSESNARTLDWNGHETLADTLTVSRDATSAMEVVTKQQLDNIDVPVQDVLVNGESVVDSSGNANIDIPIITKTVTGNPIVLDDADGAVQALSVDLLPVQDLHGYDKPWSAGAGKNKASLTNPELTETSQQTLATLNQTGTYTYTVSFNFTNVSWETSSAGLFNFIADSTNHYATANVIKRVSDDAALSILTKPVTGRFYYTWASLVNPQELRLLFMSASYGEYSGTMSNVQLEIGSTPTAWTPYSNICPITGRTQTDVVDSGKNLLPIKAYINIPYNPSAGTAVAPTEKPTQWTDNGDGTFKMTLASWEQAGFITPPLQAGKYTFKLTTITAGMRIGVYVINADNTVNRVSIIRNGTATNDLFQFTTTITDKQWFAVYLAGGSGECVIKEPQIELGETATSYAPYKSHTTTVTLPHTVYGADVDVTGGVSKENMGYVDLGSLSWGYYGGLFNAVIPNFAPPTAYLDRRTGFITSIYPADTQIVIDSASMTDKSALRLSGGIYIKDTSYSDVTTFRNSVTGQGICYELATPTDLQTTPTDVELYKGDNVVSGDGDMTMTYVRNLQMVIDKLGV